MSGATRSACFYRAGSASTTRAVPSTRSMRFASTGSWSAPRRPAGVCCAATPGAGAESTTHDARKPDHAARERAPLDSRLLPHDSRPTVGLVDRGADDSRPDRARAARCAADPLDAEPAGARAPDEGDPAEVQGRPPEDERGADEVLPGEQHQPGVVVPAAAAAVPDLHLALLRPAELLEARSGPVVALVLSRRAEHRRSDHLALVGIPADRDLRREPDRVHVLHERDDGQDPAVDHDGAADRVHPAHRALSGRPRPLLDDDEPVDGRPGLGHAPARTEADHTAETNVANAAEGDRRRDQRRSEAGSRDSETEGAAARRAPEEEEKGRETVNDDF